MNWNFTLRGVEAKVGNDTIKVEELSVSSEASSEEAKMYAELLTNVIQMVVKTMAEQNNDSTTVA